MTSPERGVANTAQWSESALQGRHSSLVGEFSRRVGQDQPDTERTTPPEFALHLSAESGRVPMAAQLEKVHERLRVNLAAWIRERRADLTDLVNELALGIHPWPDCELSDDAQLDVINELSPLANVRHQDVCEIVADRLLRLADVFREHDLDQRLITEYDAAAHRLAGAVSAHRLMGEVDLEGVATDPIGLGLVASASWQYYFDEHVKQLTGKHRFVEYAAVTAIVAAVCHSGSVDLGANLGQEKVGTSMALVVEASGFPHILLEFDQWFDSTDIRTREILLDRVFALDEALKLKDVGRRWNLTRERIRQLEVKSLEAIESAFGPSLRAAATVLNPMTNVVLPSRRFALVTRLLATSAIHRDAVAAAIAWAAGPWLRDGDWIYHESLTARLKQAKAAIYESADQYGLLAMDAPAFLDGLFTRRHDQLKFFRTALGLVEMSGYWSIRDSQRIRIVASLKRIGRPATRAEIAKEAGVSEEARVGSALSGLSGIVRADKERWAFADWVDDAYDGIVGEINQRIDANAGSVAVATLLEELPRRFGVSESSVHAYLQTPAFEVVEGFVCHAEHGFFVASPPSKWSDAFQYKGLWGQRLRIEQRHLEGYSLKVRFDIAYANGVRPNDDLIVPLDGDDYRVSVIWRAHDATWSIDVGRISGALLSRGLRPGDDVLVCPSPDKVILDKWNDSLAAKGRASDSLEIRHRDPLLDLLEES